MIGDKLGNFEIGKVKCFNDGVGLMLARR